MSDMTADSALSNIERQEQVLRFVEERRRVAVVDICDRFGVSLATARRDLEALAVRGGIQRVHGGALAVRRAPPELPALERAAEQANEKRRIGQAAAALVTDGETVFLSSGTTTLEVARGLRSLRRLTVITNSLLALNALADAPEITLVGLGGMLRRSEMSFIGHITEQALSEVRADKVIIGIRAIDAEQGLTNDFLPETMTDRAIMRIAREVIVVADHSKCGRVSAAFVAPLSAMHTLVTDTGAPPEFIAALKARGIRVLAV
jgi:DeoR family transcriptional regulator, aga operon transcriptional repressor